MAAMIITGRRLLSISRRFLFSHPLPPLPLSPSLFCRAFFTPGENFKVESPLGIVSVYGDWGLTKAAYENPGMDYNHWEIYMPNPGGDQATKHQIIQCYIQTLAKVVGSEEEAKKRIYKAMVDRRYHLKFGCMVDWDTAYKIRELPEVIGIAADYYRDVENKDYGSEFAGELLVNGEIVERSHDA